jgi:cytidylate kinase
MKSPLSRRARWFVVTRYRERHGIDTETGRATAYIVASEKFDVTDQMLSILKSERRPKGKKKT